MPFERSFKDSDLENLTKLLNVVDEATFEVKMPKLAEIFMLRTWAQKELMPKIREHVAEIKRVVEDRASEEEPDGDTSS